MTTYHCEKTSKRNEWMIVVLIQIQTVLLYTGNRESIPLIHGFFTALILVFSAAYSSFARGKYRTVPLLLILFMRNIVPVLLGTMITLVKANRLRMLLCVLVGGVPAIITMGLYISHHSGGYLTSTPLRIMASYWIIEIPVWIFTALFMQSHLGRRPGMARYGWIPAEGNRVSP